MTCFRGCWRSVTAVAVLGAGVAGAQAPVRPPARDSSVAQGRGQTGTAARLAGAFGSILGTAVDSLHETPLADAVVTVLQLPQKSAMTSSTGAFRIDSLPPGKYTLEILHAVLDTLGIRLVSDTVDVVAGGMQAATIGIPSGETLVSSMCTPLQRKLGPAMLVGQVVDADSSKPLAGVDVSVAWMETTLDTTSGLHTLPRMRKATTGADGMYHICGLPASLDGTIQAIRGDAQTGEVSIQSTVALTTRVLRLPAPMVASRDTTTTSPTSTTAPRKTLTVQRLQTGPGVVTGYVTNQGGAPVVGAHVFVSGSTAHAATTANGAFRLTGVPLGTQSVEVHDVGYTPTQLALDVNRSGANSVTLRLAPLTPMLAPVNVQTKAADDELKKVGFDHRKKMGFGRFLTQADIEKAQPMVTSDVLRLINGLHVVGSGHGASVTSSRGNSCVKYMVDRAYIDPADGVSIDEVVNPMDIAAIEFYQANDVPMEFDNPAISGCGLVIVWTKKEAKKSS